MKSLRSACPINLGLELFGDRWSLLIIRDLVFAGKDTYGEFLDSPEGISTNILANQLNKLCENGVLTKSAHPEDARKAVYRLTEKGCALIPMLYELMLWGIDQGNSSKELKAWAIDVRNNKKEAINQKLQELSSST